MVQVGDKVVSLKGDSGVIPGEIGEVTAVLNDKFFVQWEHIMHDHTVKNIGTYTEIVASPNEWEGELELL